MTIFRIARLTLQTPKLWMIDVATDRDVRHASLRYFSYLLFFPVFFLLTFLFIYFSDFCWKHKKKQSEKIKKKLKKSKKIKKIKKKKKNQKKSKKSKKETKKKKRPPREISRDDSKKCFSCKEMLAEFVLQLSQKESKKIFLKKS